MSVRKEEKGRPKIIHNGYLPECELQTDFGPVAVKVAKIRDKREQGVKFDSTLCPPYVWKTRDIKEVLPVRYLKGTPLLLTEG